MTLHPRSHLNFPIYEENFVFFFISVSAGGGGMLGKECCCVSVKIEDTHDCCQITAWVQTGARIVGVPPSREDDSEAVTVRLAQRREPVRQAPWTMGLRYKNLKTRNSKKTAIISATIGEIDWIFRKCLIQHALNLKYKLRQMLLYPVFCKSPHHLAS